MAAEIGEIEANFENCLAADDGSLVVSLRVPRNEVYTARQIVGAIKTGVTSGKERLKVGFAFWREKRSLNANSYFHVLVDKIAKAMNLGADEVKIKMVLEYGTAARDAEGEKVGIKLPVSVDVNMIYKYAKWFDKRREGSKDFNCYILYRETHLLDKTEMARLIDGVVHEAQELGIETRTPDEIASMIEKWDGAP